MKFTMKKYSMGIILISLTGCAIESPLLEKSSGGTRLMAMGTNLYHQQHGEAATIDAGKASVTKLLKDPGSAVFSDVSVIEFEDGKLVCGNVNSKNSFGGYVGNTPFAAGPYSAEIYQKNDNIVLNRAINHAVIFGCGNL